jgi:hypothetical protein
MGQGKGHGISQMVGMGTCKRHIRLCVRQGERGISTAGTDHVSKNGKGQGRGRWQGSRHETRHTPLGSLYGLPCSTASEPCY